MEKSVKQWSARNVLAGTFILSALPLLIMELFPSQLKFVIAGTSYILFHNITEVFSIMVSLSMFGVGWYAYDQSKDRHALFLSAAFLAIGLMDLMHTLSMVSMPDFVTLNRPNKPMQFWIVVRLFQAAAFLTSAYIYADRPKWWLSKKVMMTLALLVPSLAFTGIIYFPAYVPATFVPGVGLTPFKKFSEYLIVSLLCVAVAVYWRRMKRTGDRLLIYYMAAFVICIFSEIPLALYTRAFDAYIMLGHIYKVAAFSLIYYGIYKASVKAPYLRLKKVGEELERDIAERKRVEDALKESEEKYRTILENIEDGYFEVDIAGNLTFFNDSLCRMLGYSKEEMMGMNDRNYTDQENAKKLYQAFNKVYRTWEPIKGFGWEVIAKDGRKLFGEVSISLIRDSKGQPIGFRGIARDITERKRAEKALRESEERLHVLSSHLMAAQETEQKRISMELHDELGQALIALKLRLRSIQKMLREDQKVLRNECESIQGSIEQIIENVRRLSQDLSPYLLENLGLTAALRRLIDDVTNDHKIVSTLDIAEIDKSISQKRQLIIYRIFQETLTNIRRHAQATRISVAIKRETDCLSFLVEDDGKGFDVKQAMLRDAVERGLGLAAMEERVRMLGGFLNIRSEIGRGTKISFIIPVGKEGI